jgi:hypothetical protein
MNSDRANKRIIMKREVVKGKWQHIPLSEAEPRWLVQHSPYLVTELVTLSNIARSKNVENCYSRTTKC